MSIGDVMIGNQNAQIQANLRHSPETTNPVDNDGTLTLGSCRSVLANGRDGSTQTSHFFIASNSRLVIRSRRGFDMKAWHSLCQLVVFLIIVAFAVPARGQQAVAPVKDAAKKDAQFEPEVGQEGKDVIWVPTPQTLVKKMLDMAQVTPNDYVIDLGSGDGRTVIAAAERGARALGIEYNPDMVDLSRRNAVKAGVGERAKFVRADLFESDFSNATVITMFLLPDINLQLRPKILGLKPGTRIVSNSFDMEEWQPDETAEVTENCESYCKAHLWIVPATAEGTWELPQGELVLEQEFQRLSGTLRNGETSLFVTGKLRGDRLSLQAGDLVYTGLVNGESIQGSVIKKWSARKKPQGQAAALR